MQVLQTDAESVNPLSMPATSVPTSKASHRKRLITDAINEVAEQWVDRNLNSRRPSLAYWRHGCGQSLTTAALLYHFQIQFQHGNIIDDFHKRWAVKSAAMWAASSGITENEWEKALDNGACYIESDVRILSHIKQVWLRPTEAFMEVFGLTVGDYDTVGLLEKRRGKVGRPLKGVPAPKVHSWTEAEHVAFKRWCAAGGHTPVKDGV